MTRDQTVGLIVGLSLLYLAGLLATLWLVRVVAKQLGWKGASYTENAVMLGAVYVVTWPLFMLWAIAWAIGQTLLGKDWE